MGEDPVLSDMNARLLTSAALAGMFTVILPAKAADPQLLNLVMPDATVLAGVNVDQAKTSPFGQYVLGQMQNAELQQLANATGFDPTRDVHEVLAAIGAVGSKSALALARGSFDAKRIGDAAAAKGGTTTETYGSFTIIEDQKQTHGVAILSSTLAVAGDVASVKAAIDRQTATSSLPASVITQVNQWSGSQDAWVISTVPPSSLQPTSGTPKIPGVGGGNANNALQTIQQAAGGVKFGDMVVVTAQAQSDNADDAKTIAGTIQLLASVAQLQAQNAPELQALAQSLSVGTSGSTVNISFSMPAAQLQDMLGRAHSNVRQHKK